MQIPVLSRRGQVKPYGSIPRLNWQHPLARGLTTYAYDVGGVCIDLTLGGCGTLVTATTVGRKSTAFGTGYNYTAASGAIQMPQPTAFSGILPSSQSVAPWTIASGFFVTSVPGTAGIFALGDNGANNIMGAAVASSTTVDYICSNGTNDIDNVTVPNYLSKYSSIATVAPTATSAIGYFNGLNVASNAVSNACATGATSFPLFNTLQQGALNFNGLVGSVFYGAIWNRALSQAEILQLHLDPYCFLIYPEDEMMSTMIGVLASLGLNIEQDFVARNFRSIMPSMLPLLRQNPASDATVIGPQIEAPQSFINRLRTPQYARPIQSFDTSIAGPLGPQIEQQPSFLARFQPTKFNLLEELRQSDTPMPFVSPQIEAQPHFIGRFFQPRINIMEEMRQNEPTDTPGPLGPQIEAQPHFIANFKNSVMRLWPKLRQNESNPIAAAGTPTLVQHVGGGANPNSAGQSGNNYKFAFPNAIGANNCIIIAVTYPNGATPTISDNNGNTWPSATVHANAGSGNLDSSLFVLQNANAGATTFTVAFGSAVAVFQYCMSEFCNVALAGAVSGSSQTAFAAGTSLAAGSFTPAVNDSLGGNLVWAYFAKADTTGAHTPSSISSGGSFTLLDANIGWHNADGQPSASEYFVQSTSAAINPALTVTGDTDHWNSLAVSLMGLSAGTAMGTGILIAKVLHFTTDHFPASGNYTLQCPSIGNLRVIMSDDPNLHTLTVTDSDGNTYNTTGQSGGIFFAPNTSANAGLVITIAGGGADTRLSWRYCDVIGADPNPFDVFAVANQNCNGVTTVTSPPSITPTNSNGLVIANVGLGQGPGLAVTSPAGATWDLCTYTGEADTDDMENADLMAHYHNTSTGTITWTWTITNVASNSTSGGAIAFKAPSPIGGEPSFMSFMRPPGLFRMFPQNIFNPANDLPPAFITEGPPSFIAKVVTQTYQLLSSYRQNPASDAGFLTTQPETNTNFIGRFVQQIPEVLGLLRSNPASDATFLPTQPETNVNFVGRFVQQAMRLLPQLRQNEPTDATSLPTQPETNTNFIATFVKQTFLNSLLSQRQNQASDASSLATQPETNVSFIGRFTAQIMRVLPGLRHNEPSAIFMAPQPETNTNFIARFVAQLPALLPLLRSNPASDATFLPPQPETNTNFIARFFQQAVRVLPGLRQNAALDVPPAIPPDTTPSFIGKFTTQIFRLLTAQRQNEPQDASALPTQPETNVSFIGRMISILPNVTPQLRQNVPADPTLPETNTNFIGRFIQILPNVLSSLRQNTGDLPTPPLADTPTNFIGRFTQQAMRLLPGLRQNEPSGDINVLITARDFIGRFVQPAVRLFMPQRQNEAQDLPQAQIETQQSNPHFLARMQISPIKILQLMRQNRPDGFFIFVTGYARYVLGKVSMVKVTGTTMTATHDPQNFVSGDDWMYTGPLQDGNGNPLNLGGATITWNLDSTDQTRNFATVSTTSGNIAIVDPVNAIIVVDIPSSITSPIPAGNYLDACRVVLSNGQIFTMWKGLVRVTAPLI